jgi:hypothetical protein
MTELNSAPKPADLGTNPAAVRTPDPHQAQYDANATYTAEENQSIRARQAARSRIMGLLLLGLCAMFFGITLAKIGYWS